MSSDSSKALVPVTRRAVLRYAGITGLLVSVGDRLSWLRVLPASGDIIDPPDGVFTKTVRRRSDMFVVTFEFRNLKLNNGNLSKQVLAQPAYIGVLLQPQNVHERAFQLGADVPPPGSVPTRLAGMSRIAFRVPNSVLPMPYKLEELLKWSQLALEVVPAANPNAANKDLRAPTVTETAIEMPYFLILSPDILAAFAHATSPVTHANVTELWHTRLASRGAGGGAVETSSPKPIQAVWARDSQFAPHGTNTQAGPFGAPADAHSLTPEERNQIVRLTSDHTLTSGRQPALADRMMLSALGGWLDATGTWQPPAGLSLTNWRHIAHMGRDSYVRTVKLGFLAPFGHRAVRVKITERRFRADANGNLAAYLFYKVFIIVREPVKNFGSDAAPGQPNDGREFPFRSVRILTQTTPTLKDPVPPGESELLHVPRSAVDSSPVEFSLIATDWVGQETAITTPVTWVERGHAYSAVGLERLKTSYSGQNTKDSPMRKRPAHGQRIAFAPERERGDTSFDVGSLTWKAVDRAPGQSLFGLALVQQYPLYPAIEEAGLTLAAAEQAAGQSLGESVMKIAKPFVDHGFDELEEFGEDFANFGEAFLEKVPGAQQLLDFAKDTSRTGGLATPNLTISGLTRRLGPVGGAIDQIATGKFDPFDYLDPAAKLLGNLKLGDVLKVLDKLEGVLSSPLIQTTILPEQPPPPALPVPPTSIKTVLDWKPQLQPDQLHIFDPGTEGTLHLRAESLADLLNPDKSTFSVVGDLRNFTINLIGDETSLFLRLHVKRLKFTAGKDAKPDLDFVLGDIEFDGVLKFVEELRNFLSTFGKKYGIVVTPQGVSASLSLPIPSIGVGVFSINNITLGIGGIVPFNGDAARFRFNFCTRENPFKLTVAMFGGGGFFGIECGTDSSVMLEVALEFGAAVAFDIGVASGGVEIMAGIYMKIEEIPGPAPDSASLTGYLRMGGELGILGIIRISMELYLGFTYEFPPIDKCVGRATFHLEVEILIFSFSISAEIERRFGGENDPTFAQFMTPSDWTEYCEAYAAIGA